MASSRRGDGAREPRRFACPACCCDVPQLTWCNVVRKLCGRRARENTVRISLPEKISSARARLATPCRSGSVRLGDQLEDRRPFLLLGVDEAERLGGRERALVPADRGDALGGFRLLHRLDQRCIRLG